MTEPLSLRDLAEIGVGRLKGVGEKREQALREVGIETVLDLLTHYPRRWVDRTNEARVADLTPGEDALVLVTLRTVAKRTMRNHRTMVTADAGDGSGRLSLVFFNQPWRERQLRPDMQVAVFGRPETYRGHLQMTNPVVDLIGDRTGRIVAIYPQSEKAGLSTWELGGWVEEALARCRPRGIADPVPSRVLDLFDLVGRERALREIHVPDSMAAKEEARRRLVFDELLRVQLLLVLRKRALERDAAGIEHVVGGELVRRFHTSLPFALTGAQARTIAEIEADLVAPRPMHRLLQGDVGAGKTVVAVSALLAAVQGGHQGAFMAPTEVLAEQHAAAVRALLEGVSVPASGNLFGDRPLAVALLTSRTGAAERREIAAGLLDGTVDLLIGTHALIQEGVAFASLGVVVIDEQHRFGVEQRAALKAKVGVEQATVPDVLVMTATPIPRTAAMTVYGDLDVSTLDELPPGRTPVRTYAAVGPLEEARAWAEVRAAVERGEQAYVVCPLIEASTSSEKLEVASAEETFERLTSGELAGARVGLLHGRLGAKEKEAVMAAFRAHELDALVATTVIEVGIDVPNATVMVVLDADRFGIAQLHQLRGRVGRGSATSSCWLVTSGEGEPSPRVEALAATNDGFELAEVDLELRGEGTIMGERQTGRNDLKLASLRRDKEWVVRAREAAFSLVDADPHLARHPLLADELRLFFDEDDVDYLFKS